MTEQEISIMKNIYARMSRKCDTSKDIMMNAISKCDIEQIAYETKVYNQNLNMLLGAKYLMQEFGIDLKEAKA